MVWARTRGGYYEHGFLSQKDTHFNVYFYPEGELKHSVKDNTSVILDKTPDEKKIRVGSNVIVANAEKGKFEPGRVKQIWVKKEEEDKVIESGWEDAAINPDGTKFLVKCSLTGKEHWKSAAAIRLVPKPNIDGMYTHVGLFRPWSPSVLLCLQVFPIQFVSDIFCSLINFQFSLISVSEPVIKQN